MGVLEKCDGVSYKDTFDFPTFLSDGPGRHSCKMRLIYTILPPLLLGQHKIIMSASIFFPSVSGVGKLRPTGQIQSIIYFSKKKKFHGNIARLIS